MVIAAGPWVRELVPTLPAVVERQVMLWFTPKFSAASVTAEHCPVTLVDAEGGVFYTVPDMGEGVKAAMHHGGGRRWEMWRSCPVRRWRRMWRPCSSS